MAEPSLNRSGVVAFVGQHQRVRNSRAAATAARSTIRAKPSRRVIPRAPERSHVCDADHRKFVNIGAAIMGSTADKASGQRDIL
jgi:hypothetical protein